MSEETTSEKEFLAEAEVMDLSKIKDKTFCVAVARGDPNGIQYLGSTLHGPYNFTEMCQEVGDMWVKHQHHARALIMERDMDKKLCALNENTLDYIEAHYHDLILEETLASWEDKEFT